MRARVWCVAVALVVSLVASVGAGAGPRAGAGTIVFAADRAPLWFGEIYRLDRSGRRVDLSRSPALDVAPQVSPDGRLVAFSSNRGGRLALYTVRIDGTHLRRISPVLASGDDARSDPQSIVWSSDSRRIAAALPKALWLGDTAGHGRLLRRIVLAAGWAPGGGELAWQDPTDVVHVVSPTGKELWRRVSDTGFLVWSARGRLALRVPSDTIHVYDLHGGELTSFPGRTYAWSPDGSELASLQGARLQVRRDGVGRPIVDARLLTPAQARFEGGANTAIQWLGGARLRVATGSGFVGYDVAHRRPRTLPRAFAALQVPGAASADGGAVAVTGSSGGAAGTETLRVATAAGGIGPVLARAPQCAEDFDFARLQFTPDGRSLVYQSGCAEPSADLYAVGAEGRGLRRLTATPNDETEPALSPDGTQVAYVRQLVAEKCQGCPRTIWQLDAAGGTGRELTLPAPKWDAWDDFPSFSPDGATIVFAHTTIDAPGYLVTIPAGGGPQRQLPVAGDYPAWGPSRLAYLTSAPVLQTSLPDGSDPVGISTTTRVISGSLAWSRDGRLAWLGATRGGALTLTIRDGSHVATAALGSLRQHFRGSGLAWSPDGTRLALTAADAAGVSDVWTVAPDGSGLHRLTHGLGAIGRLAWAGP
jgi:Tol biopolymer transport system component